MLNVTTLTGLETAAKEVNMLLEICIVAMQLNHPKQNDKLVASLSISGLPNFD